MSCKACNHPSATSIDHLLQAGVGPSAVARRYDLGRMSVQRHKDNHVNMPTRRVPESAPLVLPAQFDRGMTVKQLVADGTHSLLVDAVAGVIEQRDLEFADVLGTFFDKEQPGVGERFIAELVACGYGSSDYQAPDGMFLLVDWQPTNP